MTWFFYYLSMYLMSAGIRFSALWNAKAKLWVTGRRNWREKIGSLPVKSNTRIWFHVSSLGEFEQARPVMEKLKKLNPSIELILTFFSPSGYTMKSGYPLAKVFYLPEDLPGNAKKWIQAIQPDFAVFVKYDLWPGYLRALKKNNTPTILISAHWTPGTVFHSSTLPPTRSLLKNLHQIFLQQAEHLGSFQQRGFGNIQVAGDTRIDRCLELPAEVQSRLPERLKSIEPFDIVAGSTWPQDEKLLLSAAGQLGLRMIIAPHDVSEENITRLLKQITQPAIRYSQLDGQGFDGKILIIDSIGLLNVLYAKGKIAYIGGGFGAGIHNTLEPIAHRKAVIFGPSYAKFPEAVDLIGINGGWSIADSEELQKVLQELLSDDQYVEAGENAFNYLASHRGASETVTRYILDAIADKT